MTDAEKDALAAIVEERWVDFQMSLSDSKRKYPAQQFKKFAQAVRSYIEQSRDGPLVHRRVVQVVNGLADCLKEERNRIPNEILEEADRLECLMFAEYDPHFGGDEPPEVRGWLTLVRVYSATAANSDPEFPCHLDPILLEYAPEAST
jgi:hypothetical protein